jgi:PAS domain S-box-containing protein
VNEMRKERESAEVRLALTSPTGAPARPAEELLHELQVHQIELEMQNEQLRQSQLDLQASRDLYEDLYEFATVGYFTLSLEGKIVRVNLTGAALLGLERKKILNSRFSSFAKNEDCNKWHLYLKKLQRLDLRQSCELTLKHGDGTLIHARLDGQRLNQDLRIALTDITEQKNLAQALILVAEGRQRSIAEINQSTRAEDKNPESKQLINNLTSSELEILHLIASGQSSQEIARLLSRSIKTIETHRANMRVKLQLKNGAALMRYAILQIGPKPA